MYYFFFPSPLFLRIVYTYWYYAPCIKTLFIHTLLSMYVCDCVRWRDANQKRRVNYSNLTIASKNQRQQVLHNIFYLRVAALLPIQLFGFFFLFLPFFLNAYESIRVFFQLYTHRVGTFSFRYSSFFFYVTYMQTMCNMYLT